MFVERQKEYSGPRFIFGLGSFGVGLPLVLFGWFHLRSALRRNEQALPTPEQEGELDGDDTFSK